MVGAGVLVAGSGLTVTGCKSSGEADREILRALRRATPGADVRSLILTDEQVISGYEFEDTTSKDYFVFDRDFELPLGSLIYQDDKNIACVLAPGETTDVLIRLGALNMDKGELSILLPAALNDENRYCIYDARLSDKIAVWVECDMTAGDWIVYAAPHSGTKLGTPQKLEEGTTDYDPPLLCVYGSTAYWTIMPDANGPAYTEDSYLKAADLNTGGASEIRTVYTSHGRMIINPQATEGHVVIAPRVDIDVVRYQLTALSTETEQVVATSLLPEGLRVSDCVYMNNEFTFCIEGSYDFAGGLRYFGTYEMLEEEGTDKALYINREPASPAAYINNCLMVKSTATVVGFDLAKQRSFIIDKLEDCAEYGDLLTGCGIQERLITYTTVVDKADAAKNKVKVRVFKKA
jgi:hypothetical protein